MLSPDKNKSLYGGDTLLRSVSLADDTLKIINRDPEKRKALQQVRRENLDTAIKLKKEAQDYYAGLEKDKNFKPTTDYQKALFSSQMKQQKWLNDDEQAKIKMQQDQRDNLVNDSATVFSGWKSLLNFADGFFNSNMNDKRKTYTDSNGKEAVITIEGKNYYKTIDGIKTLASQKEIDASKIHGKFDEVTANMNSSTAYYVGHKSNQGIYNAFHNTTSSILSGVNSVLKLGSSNAKVLDNLARGNYKSVSQAWDDWSDVNSSSLKAIYYGLNSKAYGLEEFIAGAVGATEWEKEAATYKANNELWGAQADKEQEAWYKQHAEKNKNAKSKGLGGVYDSVIDGIQNKLNTNRDFFDNYSNLESAMQRRAIELGGRTEQTFAQKTKQVDKSLYKDPITGQQFTKETVNDPSKEAGGLASAWDLKKLALNADGSVQLDAQNKPVYVDKFSKWEAFKDSNSGAVFDKYFFGDVVLTEGIETLGDIGTTLLLEKGLGAASKGLQSVSKSVKTLDKAVGLNANRFMINQSEKLTAKIAGTAEKVLDSKLGKLAESTIGGKKVTTKFAPTLKDGLQGAKGVSSEKIRHFSKSMAIAYLEGADESDQIANDVRNKIMEEKVDKLSGIDTDKIAQKNMEENPS